MQIKRLVLIITLTLIQLNATLSNPAFALPFLDTHYKVIVHAPDAPDLESTLQRFIKEQQSSNEQLKQIDDKQKYIKLLSAVIRKKLKSIGYYNFGLSFENTDNTITFAIQPGQQAIIKELKILQPLFVLENLKDIASNANLREGQPLIASEVLQAELKLKAHINENYCFVNPKLSRSITMDTTNQEVSVFFNLETEQGKNIHSVEFMGNQTIKSDFLANIVQIKSGCFKTATIKKAQIRLLQTGLLTSATPEIVSMNNAQVKIVFQVSERKHRTQSIGVGYASDEGARLNLGWEHRNWRGNAKKLSTQFKVSQLATQLNGLLRVPQFKDPNLDLLIQGEISDTKVEAFDSMSAEASSLLEYSLSQHWIVSFGVATEYSKITSINQNEVFRLLSFPLSFRWDKSNNLLDPHKGHIWTFSLQPYIDLINTDVQFTQIASSLRLYQSPQIWRLNEKKQKSFTLATRFAIGTIQGEALDAVPADQRYYVGGGGSVRGFDYQSLSPQESGVILGGLSFLEIASELRMRITPNWGASLFIDSGVGFQEQLPDLSGRLSLGGGFGIRYITSFAPIRLDIAWPLSSPIEIENKAQLYVGLKQAF